MFQRPWMQRAARKTAVQMKGAAEGRSPRETGEYSRSFDVVPVFLNIPFRGKARMRAGARLVNTSDHAAHVEYGNGKTPRYAVLHKTMDDFKAAHRGA
ncbi:hypothetical protein GTW67_13810 [Streptomyces sp. SID5910]|nr:hypothetical protein [Streptomyces sp. SID5910]